MLKELEQIDSKMIQTIFEYNKMGREELKKGRYENERKKER